MSGPAHLDLPDRTRRALTAIAVVVLALTLAGAVALRAGDDPADLLAGGAGARTFYDARVEDVDRDRPCGSVEPGTGATAPVRCPRAQVTLLEGPDQGDVVGVDLPGGAGADAPDIGVGAKIVVSYTPEAEPGFQYSFADQQRKPVLFWLAVGFALVVVALGRLRGLAALAGLAASLFVLIGFILPAILDGRSPLAVAVVGSALIAYLALYLAHGFTAMTTVALLGTLAALAVTALLGSLVTAAARLTGYASEEAIAVQLAQGTIDLSGLVLAGVVIGALGAIDDMTVTQVAAVSELHEANRELGRRDLFAAALRIGRDHVASTVNTLALAYAGASIPLLLLFLLSRQSLTTVANGEVVATEIVRTLVGSIGLVLSVPITTWLAVRAVPREE